MFNNRIQIDIWSDIHCPFCYIGKRKLEQALAAFPDKDMVDITWHSFLLDPEVKTDPSLDAVAHFSKRKRISEDQAREMYQNVNRMAQENGLQFNLENSKVSNSFKAHRLIQWAQTKGLANEMEEQLFAAHLSEGKNIDDNEVLTAIAMKVGLDAGETMDVLTSDAFAEEVEKDRMAAQQMSIHGVPFFVFNQKYAVSGAQSQDVLLSALQQCQKELNTIEIQDFSGEDQSCSIDGNC